MSHPALRPREVITFIRGESNGPLYLLVGLIALGAVGFGYWMFASYPRTAFTMTSVVSAPTAGPAATSGDVRHPPDRPASDNRPRHSAPARDLKPQPPVPIQPSR